MGCGFTARQPVLVYHAPNSSSTLDRSIPKRGLLQGSTEVAFLKSKDVKDPKTIKQMLAHWEFVVKDLEALYYQSMYRAMKKRIRATLVKTNC
uniref:Uncharacterized protein n=1 Tax=Hucho hucho TaxID=62062 RepID=A0A4W5M1D3_9TELE